MLRNSIGSILTSEGFQNAGVVILSMAISVFAKIQSRNDRHRDGGTWNDFAVGIDLTVGIVVGSVIVLSPMIILTYYQEKKRRKRVEARE